MKKSFIKKITSLVIMTTTILSLVYSTYATTNVPTNVTITRDNLFDGTSGVSISIPESMPLTINENTGNYEFEDYISASGVVYHDQNLTIAIPNGNIQYTANDNETTNLTGTVGFCDNDGNFINCNSNSFKGCPAYPYTNVVPYANWYCKVLGHILLYNDSSDTYTIIYILAKSNAFVYMTKNGDKYKLQGSGSNYWYNDINCTEEHDLVTKVNYQVFETTSTSPTWNNVDGGFLSSSDFDKYEFTSKIVQSSIPIYSDNNKSSIVYEADKNPYEATNGTYIEFSANDIAENYKEIQLGTENTLVPHKNIIKIVVNPGNINYLGNYTGTVFFETILSEHVQSP